MTPCPICGGSGKHYPPCTGVPTNRREMMGDDNTTAEGVAWAAERIAQQQAMAQTMAQRQGFPIAAQQADPDWEASLREQEQAQVRMNALGYALQSSPLPATTDEIVARAKLFETYLLGDQS